MAKGTKKRGAGEGTIYYRKGKRLWCAQVTLDDGRRKTIYGKTQGAVREKLTLLSHNRDMGLAPADGQQTLGQYLDSWLATKHDISESTSIRYKQLIDLYIKPELGKIKLPKLTPLMVQRFYARKLAVGDRSSSTINRVHGVLHNALNDAVRLELVPRNVTALVDKPQNAKTEQRTYTLEQVSALLAALDGHRYRALYLTSLNTGLRVGELIALHWRDVDLRCGTLQLQRGWTRTKAGYVEGRTKTDSSRRTVRLTPTAIEVLRGQRKTQLAERLTYGELWQEHDLVFTRNAGQHLSHSAVRYHWEHLLRVHDLPRIRPHDLRHSFTTLLLGKGVSMKTVSKMLGHSDVTITMRTYAHVTDEMQEQAVDAMEDVMRQARGVAGAESEREGERQKEGK